MNKTSEREISQNLEPYEAPQLEFVGLASDVILGFVGMGFDGPYGMMEPDFEFVSDE